MNRPAAVILVSMSALALAACGKVGTLDQPAPLWGEKSKAKYETQQAATAAAKATQQDSGQPEALPDGKVYDPHADPGPQRDQPIPGQDPSPNGVPPPGVLPDPFARPQ